MKLLDFWMYFREGATNFRHTGSFCATTKWAAQALANPLRSGRGPMQILEVGAGTGSVTSEILRDLIPGDTLVVCEINPRFIKALKERLENHPLYHLHKDSIVLFEGPIQELPEQWNFDVIVASLPFLNFELPLVEEIFSKLCRMSTPKTVMTYYEYIGLRRVGRVVSPKERRRRMLEIDQFFKVRHAKDKIAHERVWLNILPINIYTLKLAPL